MLFELRDEAGNRRAVASFYAQRWSRGWLAVPGVASESLRGAEGERLKPFAVDQLGDEPGYPIEVSADQEFGRRMLTLKWVAEESPVFLGVEEDGTLSGFRDPTLRNDRPQIRIRLRADGTARVDPVSEQ
ncbi:MAG: hypothetical protein ACLQAT_32090 [Candidatus Binataceae bacterium]